MALTWQMNYICATNAFSRAPTGEIVSKVLTVGRQNRPKDFLMRFWKFAFFYLLVSIFSLSALFAQQTTQSDYLKSSITQITKQASTTFRSHIQGNGINTPIPEFGNIVESVFLFLKTDENLLRKAKENRAFNALLIQTITHLEHVRMSFEMGSPNYTHDFVLKGPYPYRPTLIALQKAKELLEISEAKDGDLVVESSRNEAKEKELLEEQKALVKKITSESYASYKEMRDRLQAKGLNAPFPELEAVVEYLHLKIISDEAIIRTAKSNKYISAMRIFVLRQLETISASAKQANSSYPYLKTLDAIERATEFLDVVQRNNDPSRSPKLYHSGRYEYYLHYLKAQAPDHISLPTIVSLGATDILKSRGVPIGFWGVNTDVAWVDGYYQTSYEFLIHDVNHTRRMFQFFKEEADRLGMSVDEFALISDEFVKNRLMPLISIKKADDEVTKNKKRLLKVLLFEILHEDALPASREVIETAALRPPNKPTPFEKIDGGKKVVYVMEPGATTLAYVFRKLAHDFYDMPGDRQENIVGKIFRTRDNIVEAAEELFRELGLEVKTELFKYLVTTDEGFPKDFRGTLVRDIEARPRETLPLNEAKASGASGGSLKCSGLFLKLK